MTPPVRKNPEAGFAVLFVYSMAAIVAIMLFMAIPRVAFEAQRDKEQLLIDRGEQYSRAIQLYVRKFNKFPADFDALDNTQNLRFLRRHYKDPMTGKDDWRIIHVGPGGVFTDSLVYNKKKDDGSQPTAQQTFITEMQQTGGNPVDPNQNVNVATRQRQSDQPGAPGDPNNQPVQYDANGQPIQQPVQVLPNGQTVPVNQKPGQQGFNANGSPMAPGQPFPGQQFPNQQFPNQSFQNNPNNQQPFGQQPFGQQPFGQQPFGQQQPNQQQSGNPPTGAAGLINQLLTTPRPGGIGGLGGQTGVSPDAGSPGGVTTSSLSGGTGGTALAPMGGQAIGGGMGGVASKLEEDGIKRYNDQKAYNKWEFVYDITKDPARTGGTAVPANGSQQGPNGQNPNGAAPNAAGPTGASPSSSGFGGLTGTTTTNTPNPAPTTGVTTQQQ